MTPLDVGVLALLAALVAVAALVGGRATAAGLRGWYPSLRKPAWTPPGRTIAIVWSTLYVLMTLAAWAAWLAAGWPGSALPLGVFAVQLALNALWPVAFFGLRRPALGLGEIVVLEFTVIATALLFAQVSLLAAALLVPYVAWVAFAGFLNFVIWRDNRPVPRAVV